MDNIQQLKQWIDGSDRIVFFGGAGVSTESGIPDFRSVDGLYNQKYDYPPETILSHSFFMAHPEEYYKFHRDKLVVDGAKPNRAHLRLAELEREGKLQAVITQNIDGLHQAAGSKNVLELHGSIHRCYCMRCGRPYPAERVNHGTGVPHCDCGGIIRPDIVFYEVPGRRCRVQGSPLYPRGGGAHRRRHVAGRVPRGRTFELLPGQQAGAHQPQRHAV